MNNNKLHNIIKEFGNGFYIEGEATISSSIALTILEDDDSSYAKPNRNGDCSLCKRNSCENCKYYI